MNYIPEEEIRKQSWKFYFVAAAWPVYLLLIPFVFSRSVPAALVLMIFPGVYLFTWVGFLMHETWHKYVPTMPNDFFYTLLSWMLLTDPQIYKMLHGTHHAGVNSWEDREFHPLGKIPSPILRRIYNFLEIALGIGFISVVSSLMVPFNPQFKSKYRFSSFAASLLAIIIFLGGIAAVSRFTLNVPFHAIAIAFIINFWIDSVVLHHSQLVEHGNLIVPGDWHERIAKIRNLRADSVFEKAFLALTHGDSREHVLHHSLVGVYSRPFPGRVPMPPNPVYINLKDYTKILWGMLAEQ